MYLNIDVYNCAIHMLHHSQWLTTYVTYPLEPWGSSAGPVLPCPQLLGVRSLNVKGCVASVVVKPLEVVHWLKGNAVGRWLVENGWIMVINSGKYWEMGFNDG